MYTSSISLEACTLLQASTPTATINIASPFQNAVPGRVFRCDSSAGNGILIDLHRFRKLAEACIRVCYVGSGNWFCGLTALHTKLYRPRDSSHIPACRAKYRL